MTNQLKAMILDEEIKRLVHNMNEYIQDNKIDKIITYYPADKEDKENFKKEYLQVYSNLDELEKEDDFIDVVELIEELIKLK